MKLLLGECPKCALGRKKAEAEISDEYAIKKDIILAM